MQKNKFDQISNGDPVDYPFIAVQVGNEYSFFSPTKILYCQSDGNYTKVCFQNDKIITTSRNLKELELMLPDSIFVRVHHSFVINLKHVTKYVNDETQEIEMANGDVVAVSRRRKNVFLSKFIKL